MTQIKIYTTATCPYCAMAKALLVDKGITAIEEIRIDLDETMRTTMIQLTGRRTVPQIFIDGLHIGGYDDLVALAHSGKLDTLLGN